MKIRRVDFSPDEWLAGIAGMRPEEQGIYWLVCSLIYSSGGPIRDDDERLILLAGCHGNRRNAIIAHLVERGKLVRKGSEITQKRSENELEKARKRAENAAENASKRWQNNAVETTVAMPSSNANHQPSTITTSIPPKSPAKRGTTSPRANGTNPRAQNKAEDPWGLANMTRDQLRARFNATSTTPFDPEHEAIRKIIAPGVTYSDL